MLVLCLVITFFNAAGIEDVPYFLALDNGHIDIALYLKIAGADEDCNDLVRAACQEGRLDVLKELVDLSIFYPTGH